VLAIIPHFWRIFNSKNYALSRSQTPERRELDYLRYLGASDETAKEVKIFGLSDFITGRFKTLSDKFYSDNSKLAVRRSIWELSFCIRHFAIMPLTHLSFMKLLQENRL
jgi:ATP-binding cassette subfamily B protein